MSAELVDLADSVFGGATDGDGLDAPLWATCVETGLARLTLPEAAGGSGGTLVDAATVLGAAGAHAARVPLVETDLLGGWLLHTAGLPVPEGPLTAVIADLHVRPSGDGADVAGVLGRVPWARAAAGVAVLAGEHVVLLDPAGLAVTEGANLAGEPRDDLVAVDVTVRAGAVGPAPGGAAVELRLRAALGRALLLAGAARGALAQAVGYAGEREQFGRPIGRFQAVQQQLALAAAEVAAAGAAADAAAGVAQREGVAADATAVAVAAAKARAGEAAGVVARVAHQVHGAIGFTREHDLRLRTTRLWAWRDEDGSDAQWHAELGTRALAAGPDGLWPLLTGAP
ncbi:MAG: acyl-CoA dehydrogenase family protein [Pseudonocardia sp.]